jgi:hypothetical protein
LQAAVTDSVDLLIGQGETYGVDRGGEARQRVLPGALEIELGRIDIADEVDEAPCPVLALAIVEHPGDVVLQALVVVYPHRFTRLARRGTPATERARGVKVLAIGAAHC